MKARKVLLAIVLLSLSFCLVSGVGYGVIPEWLTDIENYMDMKVNLLEVEVAYMMSSPTSFLQISLMYDRLGDIGERYFPNKGINTKGKITVTIADTRGVFSNKSGQFLLRQFGYELITFYSLSFLDLIATDMDIDIVVRFLNEDLNPIGYFYQGEYHLWEE